MLDTELELGQLAQALEVLGLGHNTLVVLDRLQEITEDGVRQLAIAIAAEVASSLMNILRCPEGAVGNINVDSQASAWLANRRYGLGVVSDILGLILKWEGNLHCTGEWMHRHPSLQQRHCQAQLRHCP